MIICRVNIRVNVGVNIRVGGKESKPPDLGGRVCGVCGLRIANCL